MGPLFALNATGTTGKNAPLIAILSTNAGWHRNLNVSCATTWENKKRQPSVTWSTCTDCAETKSVYNVCVWI